MQQAISFVGWFHGHGMTSRWYRVRVDEAIWEDRIETSVPAVFLIIDSFRAEDLESA